MTPATAYRTRLGSVTGAPADTGAAEGPPSFRVASRQWRTALIIVAVILLGGILMALLAPVASSATANLDPASTAPAGARAVADILTARGTAVERATTTGSALAAVRRGAGTLLITSPDLLSHEQLAMVARAHAADVVLVEPDQRVLAALAPAVTLSGVVPVAARRPGCRLRAAMLAGRADMGGPGLQVLAGPGTVACYLSGGRATLLVLARGLRAVTILGSGALLKNQNLARLGNAALALNLLGTQPRIAWLVPQPAAPTAPASSGRQSIGTLIPLGAYLVAAELGVALLLVAAWRARRLGPLVPEQLPVVVRASETTEAHARLYQARRARDQAAAALRNATIRRLARSIGLAPGAPALSLATALAARSARQPDAIDRLLSGPAPRSDAELVTLAEDLAELETEVRAR